MSVSVAAIVIVLILCAAPATASPPAVPAGQLSGFPGLYGVVIDAHNDVWIGDSNGLSEYKPYPSTEKLLELKGIPIGSFGIDSANGYVYVDTGLTIEAFNPVGQDPSTPIYKWEAPGQHNFNFMGGAIAIDNSGGPSNGRIYAMNTCIFCSGQGVFGYTPAGEPTEFEAIGGNQLSSGGIPTDVEVDNQGNVYVAETEEKGVYEYHSSGEFAQSFTSSESGWYPSNVAVDPTSGNVFVYSGGIPGEGGGSDLTSEFTSEGEFIEHTTDVPPGDHAFNSEGYFYDPSGENVQIFYPLVILPKLTYQPVTEPTPTSGTVNAAVDPNGGSKITSCHFEYGLKVGDYALGKLPCFTGESGHEIEVGTPSDPIESPIDVHAGLSSLTTEVTYHYRLLLSNGSEEVDIKRGADHTYTPHHVLSLETENATDVTATTAILNGSF